jgi:hypothetical protein
LVSTSQESLVFPVHSIPYLVSGLSSHHSLTLLSTEQIRSLVGGFATFFPGVLNNWWVVEDLGMLLLVWKSSSYIL